MSEAEMQAEILRLKKALTNAVRALQQVEEAFPSFRASPVWRDRLTRLEAEQQQ